MSFKICLIGFLVLYSLDPVPAQKKEIQTKKKSAKPFYTISKETTFVTGPITKDGHIDFVAAINNRNSKGVTPQNNATVLYLKAMGPISEGKVLPKELFENIGMEVLPLKGEYFIQFGEYLESKVGLKDNSPQRDKLYQNHSKAGRKPWRVSEFPHVAGWLKANEKSLSLIIEGSKRSRFYLPIVRPPTSEFSLGLISDYSMMITQNLRSVARLMSCYTMLQIAEGNHAKAWEASLALHRMARYFCNGPTIMNYLVGLSVGQIAIETELMLLHHANQKSKFIVAYQKSLAKLPPRTRTDEIVNYGERITFLDSWLQVMKAGLRDATPMERQKLIEQYDLDAFFRTGMKGYDRAIKIMRLPDYRKRQATFKVWEKELKKLPKANVMAMKFQNGKLTKKESSVYTAKILIALIIPAFVQIQISEMRIDQRQNNIEIAFALAAYRNDHNKYADKLTDLLPKYLDKIPNDLYTGKPLKYKTTKNGYLLYSVGLNGRDDGGKRERAVENGADDIAIEMPIPKEK